MGRASLFLIAFLSSLVLTGFTAAAPAVGEAAPAILEVVRAQAFELVDSQGVVRARLSCEEDGRPALVLRGKAGVQRAVLALKTDGSPMLSFTSTRGEPVAGMLLLPDGTPMLALKGPKGAVILESSAAGPVASLRDAPDRHRSAWAIHGDDVAFILYRQTGEAAASLDAINGSPSLTLWGLKGETEAKLEMPEDKAPGLIFLDAAGQLRLALGIDEGVGPHLVLSDGKIDRAALTVDPKDGPLLRMLDQDGKAALGLAINPQGARGMMATDEAGAARVWVGMDPTFGPRLSLKDAKENERATLSLAPDESPSLGLWGDEGQTDVALAIPAHGRPLLQMRDAQKNMRVWLGLDPKAGAALRLYDASDRNRVLLFADDQDRVALGLLDVEGKPRLNLSVSEAGLPGMSLYGPNMRLGIALAVPADGFPGLSLLGSDGNVLFRAPADKEPEAPAVTPAVDNGGR